MPEIKHTFTQGKMNKDLDERIVPNGQYRDALNIQVSTTDGSDVGTVQNILGNTQQNIIPKATAFGAYAVAGNPNTLPPEIPVDTIAYSIGSIADEKNDLFYNFVRHGLDTQLPFELVTNTGSFTDSIFGETPDFYLKSNGIHKYKNYIFQHKATEDNTNIVVSEEHTIVLEIFNTEFNVDKNFGTFGQAPPSGFDSKGLPTSGLVNAKKIAVAVPKNTLKVDMKVNCFAAQQPDANSPTQATTIKNLFEENTVIEDIVVAGSFTLPTTGQAFQKLVITLSEPYTIVSPNQTPNFFVFEDLSGPLNFQKKNYITGINVIDDLLFFTDGFSEPKKINVPRCIEGTVNNSHTLLVNPKQNITIDDGIKLAEEHVTVIRKAPTLAPDLELLGADTSVKGSVNFSNIFEVTDIITLTLNVDDVKEGEILALKQTSDSNGQFDTKEASIRVLVIDIDGFDYTCRVLSIENNLDFTDTFFIKIDTFNKDLYKLKFPRFAFRYKYLDGEYSAFSPFSEIAFLPSQYDYSVNKGYNLGMENSLRQINITNIVQKDLPEDVKEIELLYKESNSTNVYKVTSFKYTEDAWTNNIYTVEAEHIESLLPSNQLLRPWDNVPRTALAQEMSSSRLIYGNYLQNYNFNDNVELNIYLEQRSKTFKSLKSIREYQVGVVYADKYQRQSPVFSNNSGSFKINKLDSGRQTQLALKNNTETPPWAEYFKVFIKETSTEYYNLALDRYFDAKDGNIWLSFASSDRNKLDIDTSLILKKRLDVNVAETSGETYKILAIENEAPEYIKTRKAVLGFFRNSNDATTGNSNVFDNSATGNEFKPVRGNKEINLNNTFDNTLLEDFHLKQKVEDRDRTLFVRFIGENSNNQENGKVSDYFEIDNVKKVGTGNTAAYKIIFKKALNDTVDFIDTTPGAVTATYNDTTNGDSNIKIEITQDIVQNLALFQGRFFVKILRDTFIETAIIATSQFQQTKVVKEIKAFYAKDFTNDDTPGTTAIPLGGSVTSNKTKAEHATEITSYNNNHGVGVDIPTDAYASYFAWRSIYEILRNNSNNTSSSAYGSGGWIIDEAYAAGEEPFWGLANFDVAVETEHWNGSSSTIFGKTLSDQVGNLSTAQHQSNSGNPFPANDPYHSFANQIGLTGLGLGSNTSNHVYYSTGAGVTTNTIDLSYVGPYNINNPANYIQLEELNSAFTNALDYFPGSVVWNDYWRIGEDYDKNAKEFADNLIQGNYIRFTNDPNSVIYKIKNIDKFYKFNYHDVWFEESSVTQAPFSDQLLLQTVYDDYANNQGPTLSPYAIWFGLLNYFNSHHNRRVTFRLELEDLDGNDPDWTDYHPLYNNGDGTPAQATTIDDFPCAIEIITNNYILEDNEVEFPENPAIFETEPKEDQDLEIYYEATDFIPTKLNAEKAPLYSPIGALVSAVNGSLADQLITTGITAEPIVVQSWDQNSSGGLVLTVSNGVIGDIFQDKLIKLTNNDGAYKQVKIIGFEGTPTNIGGDNFYSQVVIEKDVSNQKIGLNWFNCYSFGNGVESDRIRDTFNSITIDNGAKASSTLEEPYEEQTRKHGLIYSGLYNSTSGVNNLNQFIQAEKITKDLNPTYGSIQKLFSRQTDLVAFCEDRVLKVLANKDAVFNADGNPQLTASNRVLGQTVPFLGDYGISKNPESFASYGYRSYFTDKQRGAVLRLSMDGLTPISDAGMSNYFIDNFKHEDSVDNRMRLLGGYDIENQAYDLTLTKNFSAEGQYDTRVRADFERTISYQEDVKGWTSFKSYIPEQSVSVSGSYFSMKNGEVWKHYTNVTRNSFYGEDSEPSTFQVLLNDSPSTVKNYYALGYEGTQSKIDEFAPLIPGENIQTYGDGEYYNLTSKKGWYTEFVVTDLQEATIDEFIKKEGKWYNYLKGTADNVDTGSFHTQGIGRLGDIAIAPDPNAQTSLFTLRDVRDFTSINANNVTNTTHVDDNSFATTVHTEDVEHGAYHSGNSVFSNLKLDSFNITPKDGFNIAASDFIVRIPTPGFSSPGVLFANSTNTLATDIPAQTIFLNTNSAVISPHGETLPGNNPNNIKCETIMRISSAGQTYNDYGSGQVQQLLLTELYPGVKEIFLIEEYDVQTATPGYRYPYPDRIRCEVVYSDGPDLGWTMPNQDFEILIDIKRTVPVRPI